MVRENRIKFEKISGFTVNAAAKGFYTENEVNGEILRVRIANPATAGSLYVYESGNGISFGVLPFSSGATQDFNITTVPYTDDLGKIGSPNYNLVHPVTVDKIGITGSGMTSGTNITIGDIYLFYR